VSAESVELEPETAAVAEQAEMPADAEVPAVGDESLDLAEALRRAASQMESEGVVPAPEVEELLARRPLGEAVVPAGLLGEIEIVDSATDAAAEEAPAAWPWEAGEGSGLLVEDASLLAEAPVLEDAPPLDTAPADEPEPVEAPSTGVFTPVGIDEPELEDVTLLTPADGAGWLEHGSVIASENADGIGEKNAPDVSAEDNSLVELQVILGEYGTVAAEPAESGTIEDEVGAGEGSLVEAEMEAPAAEVGMETPAAATEAAVAATVEAPAAGAVEAPAEPQEEPKVYEPGGLDIATYTCDDCVYVETCPKAKQDGPATCGSFQWKSV
jgi:hypothetical protein